MPNPQPERVIAYIDGFNLYFGLREAKLKRFYWLNIQLLIQNLLKPNQQLVGTKYFTALVSAPGKEDSSTYAQQMRKRKERQGLFIEALKTLPDFAVYYGHYYNNPITCKQCKSTWPNPKEKMTDVNMATQMLLDAFENRFDTVILVSADSDLVPPVDAIRKRFSGKRVVVVFPPKRESNSLKHAANAFICIGEATLAKSQFPQIVVRGDGYKLHRPKVWK